MLSLDRRRFLGSSLGSLAAASLGSVLYGQDEPRRSGGEFAPDSLLLTWQQDPTTTMTIQWVASATTDDVSIHYAPLEGNIVQWPMCAPRRASGPRGGANDSARTPAALLAHRRPLPY